MEYYCLREDKNDQTTWAQTEELAIQTELSLQKERNGVDVEQQTDMTSSSDEGIQTLSVEMKDTESMTSAIKSIVKKINRILNYFNSNLEYGHSNGLSIVFG